MWRLRTMVVLAVFAGVLIFGATVAYGKWHWNARIDVEGTVIRTDWAVDEIGSPDDYYASIVVTLPSDAQVGDIEPLSNEDVTIKRSDKLQCVSAGVEAKVAYKIEATKAVKGNQVDVTVITTEDQVLGEKTGKIGKKIKLNVLIPTDGTPSCYGSSHHSHEYDKKDKKDKKDKDDDD